MVFNNLKYKNTDTSKLPVQAYFDYTLSDEELSDIVSNADNNKLPENAQFENDVECCLTVHSEKEFRLDIILKAKDDGEYWVTPKEQPASLRGITFMIPYTQRDKVTHVAVEFDSGIISLIGIDAKWMYLPDSETIYGKVLEIKPNKGMAELKNKSGKNIFPILIKDIEVIQPDMIGKTEHRTSRIAYFEMECPDNIYEGTIHAMREYARNSNVKYDGDTLEKQIASVFNCRWIKSVANTELSKWVHKKVSEKQQKGTLNII